MAAAFVLSASGTATITVALGAERHAPTPQLVAADSTERLTRPSARPELTPRAPGPAPGDLGPALPPSDPVTLDVPAIDVASPLLQVGLTEDQAMEVPEPGPHYNDAAWYKHSVAPGSRGPAVIIGHVDSAAEGPSVFFDLEKLQQGDEVLVARADGLVAEFRVDEVDRYPKDDFPTSKVYGRTDRAELRLITCGGVFDGAAGHYLDNVVVFATLVGSR